MTHGLVLGKFYPPHAGHHHLIDTALAQCDRVTVIVAASSQESIPLDLRRAWLQQRHPTARVVAGLDDHPVDYDDPAVWDLHMAVFTALCPEPVDVVFTSELYGPELARRFGGARHVTVDLERTALPVSGTAVRADPARAWRYLEPPVRAYLTKRVALVGAESTGKTTLARALAEHYGTTWVPEYGRAHTEALVDAGTPMDEIDWTDEDFEVIAARQQADEDAAALNAGPVLICDTDALATSVWQERYRGASTPRVRELAASRAYDLYVLTSAAIPFAQDGYRDGEHVREWMNGRFRERLGERSEPMVEVGGSAEECLEQAVAAIDQVLRWTFAEPIG